MVDEGPQRENEWHKAKAGKAIRQTARPMPTKVKLGDFFDKNAFAPLASYTACPWRTPASTTQPASSAKPASSPQPASTTRRTTTATRLSNAGPLMCIEEADDEDQVLAAASEAVKIRVAIDSAAVDHVIHPRDLPSDVEYIPNTSGRHFVGANDAHIEKYGSCQTVLSSADTSIGCQWQMADVNRSLHSVARVTGPKDGPGKQDVLFDNEVCVVMPPGTVKEILKRIKPVMQYKRQGNLYIAELSMTSMPSFQRQGQGA